jgi:hypothetical protein
MEIPSNRRRCDADEMDAVLGCEMLWILKKTISYINKKNLRQKQRVPQSMHTMQLSDQSPPL